YGTLTIDNEVAGGTAASGQLDLAPGLDQTDLWFSQSGNNLLIDVLGSQSTITVQDWSGANPSAILAFIKGGDGFRIDTQIDQLVGAMATYSADNPGFSPATATQMPTDPTLQNALQSAWHH
ncbi:MAG TPA: hypothetical protein VH855_24120, partial [Acetobacteraceae bacterium]